MRRAARATLALTLGASLACSGREDVDRRRALDEPTARRLVGTWDVTFQVDRSMRVAGSPSPHSTVTGTIALVENRVVPLDAPQLRGATHHGAYDIDFAPLGFALRDAGAAPDAMARTAGDSVVIVFESPGAAITLHARGAFSHDTLFGIWSAESPRAGATGRFTMRRRRAES